MTDILERAQFEVTSVRSGTEALALLQERPCDLVIADIYVYKDGQISTDGGLRVIGAIRKPRSRLAGGTRRDVPIIAISAAVDKPGHTYILNVAKSVGADAELAKPFDEDALLTTVSECLDLESSGDLVPPV